MKMLFRLLTKFLSAPQSKLTSTKGEEVQETEGTNKSLSNHFFSRLASNSAKALTSEANNNTTNSLKHGKSDESSRPPSILDGDPARHSPPERPPKRPHLRPRSSSPPPPPLLPRAHPPPICVDENNVEDLELKKIEETAEQLRNLVPNIPTFSRTPSPDFPLPPPPKTEDEDDVMCSDEPLPPPPTPNEVNHLLTIGEGPQGTVATLPRANARSPPVSYPKNSFMSYRNDKQPGRLGYDGNYHRKSSANLNASENKDSKQSMESVMTSLTPTAWERYYNIGRTSSTVVFTSHDLRPSGALKAVNDSALDHGSTQTDATDEKINPKRNKLAANDVDKVQNKSVTSASFSYGDCSVRRISMDTRSSDSKHSTNAFGAQKACWTSLDSLMPKPSKSTHDRETSASWPFGCCNDQSTQPMLHSSHSSLRLSDSETQTSTLSTLSTLSDISDMQSDIIPQPMVNETKPEMCNDSEIRMQAKKSLRDQRKNSSTQTALEASEAIQHMRQVEVTTQTTPSITKSGRLRQKEVLECDQLTKVLASQLPEEDRALQALLIPKSQLKTTADYMEGLFEMEPSHIVPAKNKVGDSRDKQEKNENSPLEENKRSLEAAPLPADSAYYTTSESKAKFLIRYSDDVNKPLTVDAKDTAELGKRKEELINSIGRKLDILRAEKLAIQEEIQANQELGLTVTARIEKLAKTNELDKYKEHIEETERITSLLLNLSGRLARAENALMSLGDGVSQEKKRILEAKRDTLFKQHEEAKELKENIDRRSQRVSDFLLKYLTADEYADYEHFIKMKSKLLIDSKEIDEKISLGKEQLSSLKDSLERKS